MSQTWKRLTFLHWRYEPAVLRKHIPSELAIDTFDGAAWLGLVPFEIYSAIPHFPETNVRTYVVGPDGSRAVWFFSLDADAWRLSLAHASPTACHTSGRRCG